MAHSETIYFYRSSDRCGVLTNFARTPLQIFDKTWPTSEHLFQAFKFTGDADNPEYREIIRKAESPFEAAKLGRCRQIPIRSDWDRVKVLIMYRILHIKVEQHVWVRNELLSSGSAILVENSPKDAFWGNGPNKDGLNMLGKLWMKVRSDIQ